MQLACVKEAEDAVEVPRLPVEVVLVVVGVEAVAQFEDFLLGPARAEFPQPRLRKSLQQAPSCLHTYKRT